MPGGRRWSGDSNEPCRLRPRGCPLRRLQRREEQTRWWAEQSPAIRCAPFNASSIRTAFWRAVERGPASDAAVEFPGRGSSRMGALFAVHSLRTVSESLPDVSGAGAGDGFAARADSPGAGRGPGPAGNRRELRDAHRSLPRLPRMRDRVSVGRAIRKDTGTCAGADREELFIAAPAPGWRAGSRTRECSRILQCCGFSPACCCSISAAGRSGWRARPAY